MQILKWTIIVLSVLNFGFMNFDGARGLIVGDYVRPKTGEYAGQLGPWSKVVEKVGIDPESNIMKWTFLIWGGLGLVTAVSFAMGISGADKMLLIMNALSMWYLIPGTILSFIVSVLMLIYIRK